MVSHNDNPRMNDGGKDVTGRDSRGGSSDPGTNCALGIALFNAGQYFEAHEALEDAWRATTGADKLLLQALTQAAVALHHHSTGNLVGAESVMARALENLDPYTDEGAGLALDDLRPRLEAWLHAVRTGKPVPAPPQIAINAHGQSRWGKGAGDVESGRK
jgi:hypothetical protein